MKRLGKIDMLLEIQVALVMLILAFAEFAPVSESISKIAFYIALAISFGNNIIYVLKERKEKNYISSYFLVGLASVILYVDHSWGSCILILCINLILGSQIKYLKDSLNLKIGKYTSQLEKDFIAFSKGKEVSVKGNKIKKGNIFLAREGEILATDGLVFYGEATVEDNLFNRNVINVSKGSLVLAGSKVVEGNLQVEALASQEESFLGQLISRLKNCIASERDEDLARVKVLNVFKIISILLASLLYFGPILNDEYGLIFNHRLAVIILLISATDGVVDLIRLAYKKFIFSEVLLGCSIKKLKAFKDVRGIKYIALEQRKDFAYGSYELVAIREEEGFSKEELLVLAAHAQHKSSHPVAEAIKKGYAQLIRYKGLDMASSIREDFIQKFEELSQMGVTARVKGDLVFVGNEKLMRLINIRNLPTDELKTVFVAINGKYAGSFILRYIENEGIDNINRAFKEAGIVRYANVVSSDKDVIESLFDKKDKKEGLAFISSQSSGEFYNLGKDRRRESLNIGINSLESRKISENVDISIMKDDIYEALSTIKKYKRFLKKVNIVYSTILILRIQIYCFGMAINLNLSSIFAMDILVSFFSLYFLLNKNEKNVDRKI